MMGEKRVLIVPLTAVGMQGDAVVCQLENGMMWALPLPIYQQFTNTLLEEEEKK